MVAISYTFESQPVLNALRHGNVPPPLLRPFAKSESELSKAMLVKEISWFVGEEGSITQAGDIVPQFGKIRAKLGIASVSYQITCLRRGKNHKPLS
jgi:hypothetical protein